MSELKEWETFYVIIGAAAGALIGLQFVVMTLIAERPLRDAARAGAAFATPTIVHFSVVLFLSGLLTAPWHAVGPVAMVWALTALAGLIYSGIVVRRMKQQTSYEPDLDDWMFYGVLPLVAYASLGLLAVAARSHLSEALFGVGAVALLLLFVGIHNAWDTVVYHVLVKQSEKPPPQSDV
jgi:hypothetical protein